MSILLTGGAGFIGSHTAVSLLNAGQDIVIVDNLYNSSPKVIDRIERITGKRPIFVEADCCDRAAMDRLFSDYDITGVIHFAGLKAVGESVEKPRPRSTATSLRHCMRRRRPAAAPIPTAGRSS